MDCAISPGNVHQCMKPCLCRQGEYSQEFEVTVGVLKSSLFSPLLFIIVLEALSCELHSGVPCKDLYANDLVIISDSIEEGVDTGGS